MCGGKVEIQERERTRTFPAINNTGRQAVPVWVVCATEMRCDASTGCTGVSFGLISVGAITGAAVGPYPCNCVRCWVDISNHGVSLALRFPDAPFRLALHTSVSSSTLRRSARRATRFTSSINISAACSV